MSFSQLNLLYTVVLSLLIEIVLKKKRKKEEEKIVLKLQIVGLIICLKTGIICRALCNVKIKTTIIQTRVPITHVPYRCFNNTTKFNPLHI